MIDVPFRPRRKEPNHFPILCFSGDVNDDGHVDVADLLLVIGDWGCAGTCVGDVDGDGSVTVGDLLLVIANWGT